MLAATDWCPRNDVAGDRVVAGFAFAATPAAVRPAAVAADRAAARATRCHLSVTISFVSGALDLFVHVELTPR
jgi:hypothetical protein